MALAEIGARLFALPRKARPLESRFEDGPSVEEPESEERKGSEVELEVEDAELETLPVTPKSKSGSQGSVSGGSSSIGEKRDVFIHFEVLRASQHKVPFLSTSAQNDLEVCILHLLRPA